MTLPCDISSADRALIQLSGPSNDLSRKGFESGRYWLEQETDTVEVLAGDEPHESSSKLTAAILLSNVTEVPRIDEMQEQLRMVLPVYVMFTKCDLIAGFVEYCGDLKRSERGQAWGPPSPSTRTRIRPETCSIASSTRSSNPCTSARSCE